MMKNMGSQSIIMCFALLIQMSTFASSVASIEEDESPKYHQNIFLNETVPSIIKSYGYPVEIHSVTTEDGYILEMHRIPFGKTCHNSSIKRPPVLLHHGLTSSSADYVLNTPGKAMAFLMADAGYDVWMANARGNLYSQKHVKYSPLQSIFFQFSWDEIALYDLPAEIDYILENTGKTNLSYVGFSMGTTVFFALHTLRPDIAKKIKVMAGMAPVAYVKHAKGLTPNLAPSAESLYNIFGLMGITSLLLGDEIFDEAVMEKCGSPYTIKMRECINILDTIVGPDHREFYEEILPLAFTQTPATVSSKTLLQYAQLMLSGKFCMFDYGTKFSNRNHYGLSAPPDFNLTLVNTPLALFHGANDFLSTPQDYMRLQKELPNIQYTKYLLDPPFNHLHFIWGKDAPELVYTDLIEFLNKYQ